MSFSSALPPDDRIHDKIPLDTLSNPSASGKNIGLRDFSDDVVGRLDGDGRVSPTPSSKALPGGADVPEHSEINSSFTESIDVDPRRRLSFLDVAALIIDQMIGTGIFTTPGLVLSLTKSKPVSLVLWGLGGVHSFIW